MGTGAISKIRIFLASSSELKDDRVAFADFILQLQNHYQYRNMTLLLDKWEYLENDYTGERRQDIYNELIKKCDVFVVLFWKKAGKYTLEEFNVALDECKRRKLPMLIYFKALKGQTDPVPIKRLKKRIENELKHFWSNYDNNDKLHLDFVLWIDKFINGGKGATEIKDGNVTLDGLPVADISQLSFFTNNEDYRHLMQEKQKLLRRIKLLYQSSILSVNSFDNKRELEIVNNRYNELEKKINILETKLLNTAKFISTTGKEISPNRRKPIIDAFESGKLRTANTIIAVESVLHKARQNEVIDSKTALPINEEIIPKKHNIIVTAHTGNRRKSSTINRHNLLERLKGQKGPHDIIKVFDTEKRIINLLNRNSTKRTNKDSIDIKRNSKNISKPNSRGKK